MVERGYFWDAAFHAVAGAGDDHGSGGDGDHGAEGDGNVVDDDGDQSLFLIHQLNSVNSCTSVSKSFHRRKEGSFLTLLSIVDNSLSINSTPPFHRV